LVNYYSNIYLTFVASGKCKWLEIWYTRNGGRQAATVHTDVLRGYEDLAGWMLGTHRVARQEEWSGEEGVIRYVTE
jgi:hypothetical protein